MDHLEQNINNSAAVLNEIISAARQEQAAQWSSADATPRASIQAMRKRVWVNPHWEIAWPHWPSGIMAKVVAIWQKFSRRLLQWYIEPIIQQQNEFNQVTLRAVELLALEVSELKNPASTVSASEQARLDQLATQLDELQTAMAQERRP
jgi:hypothetical protein